MKSISYKGAIMSKIKIIFGIFLITLMLSTLLFSAFPSLYSNNKTGKIYKQVDTNFNFLKNENSEYVLLYFGYVGCTTICTPALTQINQIYKELDSNKFAFYFINLQVNTPEEIVDQFAKYFNKNFNGIYLNNEEIKKITNKLSVKHIPSMVDKNEIDHTGFLYVLKKEKDNIYQQKFLYTTKPFQIEEIINDLNNTLGASV
jgi:protein SCO1/2